ncbi:MAG: hypothetical protein GQ477_01215 [Nanohaloarchaea archaeon]|nr:hypothetical protein [Candidatus Nanohaloarchaea archaeon]
MINTILLILIVYLALMFGIAWYFSRDESLDSYFLNKKKTRLWMMTFSNAATVMGAGAVVGIVGEVYNSGISYGLSLPISFIAGMIILGLMAKKIKEIGNEYGAYTIVDFFEKRFDKKNKILTSVLQLIMLVVWVGVQAIAIASLSSVLLGFDLRFALVLTALITIIYTSIGGLKVDIITDVIQFWIIAFVFIAMAFIGYTEIGSISNLVSNLTEAHLDPFNFGGVGWMIGIMLISGFLYVGNTTHWQRIFSAEDPETAKNSFFLSIPFLVILAVIVIFLGLLSSVLLTDIQQDTAIFSLMVHILPPSLVGLGFASIIAVVMSSIDSLLIGGSRIIYGSIFKQSGSETKKDMFYARLITAIFGLCGFMIASFVPNIITLGFFVSYLALIFVPPTIAGLYSKKTSSDASFYSILIPTILLFVLFPILKENTFAITTPLGIMIVVLYDICFKSRYKVYNHPPKHK